MGKLFSKVLNAGVGETLKEGTKLIDELFTNQEEKMQAKMELFKLAVTDRNSARELYKQDSWLQKAFAIFFLIAWCGLTVFMLYYFIFNSIDLKDWQVAFISSVNGGLTTKLSTIIDFLFGGSAGAQENRSKDK